MQAALEKAWNSTCRVVFGRELGKLDEYREWLSGYLPKSGRRKSYLTGREVSVAMDAYSPDAAFVSEGELAQDGGFSLGINQIKDLDSILEGLGERCEYSGNRHLGNSMAVENSDIVIDSQYVANSTNIEESRYVDSSFMVRKGSKCIFGSGILGQGEFLVRVVDSFDQKRSFESSIVGFSTDCYFCHNVLSCRDMLFSFGQRSKSYCIANTPMSREKYLALKAKILSEVADYLQREKSFPSLTELVPAAAPAGVKLSLPAKKDAQDMRLIEKGFATTYNLLLKRQPSSIVDYEQWLAAQGVDMEGVRTPFGEKAWVPKNLPHFRDFPRARVVTMREALEIGKTGAGGKVDGLKSGIAALSQVAFFTPELADGQNMNLVSFPHAFDVVNAYKGHDGVKGEHIGVSSFALNSKYVYGCYRAIESQFALKCCNSQYLNRCMEMDSCNKCADSYFCHNSEALSECMFCFNLKGRRYAVGNTVLPREKYVEVKSAVLAQIEGEIAAKKGLGFSIFDLTGGKGRRA